MSWGNSVEAQRNDFWYREYGHSAAWSSVISLRFAAQRHTVTMSH